MLSVVIPSIVCTERRVFTMLSVFIPNVIMLSVIAPNAIVLII
jgi:hypothetical protein